MKLHVHLGTKVCITHELQKACTISKVMMTPLCNPRPLPATSRQQRFLLSCGIIVFQQRHCTTAVRWPMWLTRGFVVHAAGALGETGHGYCSIPRARLGLSLSRTLHQHQAPSSSPCPALLLGWWEPGGSCSGCASCWCYEVVSSGCFLPLFCKGVGCQAGHLHDGGCWLLEVGGWGGVGTGMQLMGSLSAAKPMAGGWAEGCEGQKSPYIFRQFFGG
jgi:hypothetical protein